MLVSIILDIINNLDEERNKMNTTFLIALGFYLLLFMIIGLMDVKKIKTFNDYGMAGKDQGTFAVTTTLLATVLGASTTIGIVDTVYQIGFPGIWWLIFGALGLLLQSFILSEKVRETGADTLPHLARITMGRTAELLLALIIVISWIGVIAGQLVAMNSLVTFAIGRSSRIVFVVVSIIVLLYTMVGGQLSVVKTDKLQLIIIFAGIIICCLYLYLFKGGDTSSVTQGIELLNKDYRPMNLFTQFFVIGGVYFLGPDIMSRNFISKDEKTAKRSAFLAGIILLIFSVVITFTGMWVRANVTSDELGDSKALMYVIGLIPRPVGIILIFGLLSAILSSTDTCIINASTIFVKDVLGKEDISLVRITVGVIGMIATVLAVLGRGDILTLLTGAYSIYTPGVIFPLFIAIICYKKREIRKGIWILGPILGGILGIAGTYFGNALVQVGIPEGLLSYITLIGMGISLITSLLSIKRK
ncbi:solute:Na+ symporter, SSS family [Lachnospiraceae bacterium]|nr:solute:Na+ symporter, SSS family [Lachnospiraceae bacterium]